MNIYDAANKIDLRQALYHYMMMGEGVEWILSKIDPSDLSSLGKNIYESAENIISEGKEVDIILMKARTQIEGKNLTKILKTPEIGYKTTVRAFNFENSEIHARNVIKQWLQDGDVFENMDKVLQRVELYRQKAGYNNEDIKTIQDGIQEVKDYSLNLIDGKITKLNTNLTDLDRLLGGFEGGEFIIIGARPSVGKTALTLQIAKDISKHTPVGFFSLEMTVRGLAYRQIHEITGKSKQEIQNDKDVLLKSVKDAYNNLKDNKLFINQAALSYHSLRNRFEAMVNKGCKIIFIDYLQLINHSFNNQNEGYGKISMRIKQLAKEFNIPIVALSQLNRKSEERKYGEPFLSDLRESGQIEQDADKVGLLWRRPKESLSGAFAEDLEQIAEDGNLLTAKIVKNRDGEVGNVNLYFDKQKMRISCVDVLHVEPM